ncbi:MAG: site-specific DNA-methyltransferase [Bdellovibrionales bacterium]|nr:site-specific DNA-methyltransferase [Bdellovibrionales bacterium]
MFHNVIDATDCRKAMDNIPENVVSMILTDPPYFIDGMDNNWDHSVLKKRARNAGVVGSLPIGMKFDYMQARKLYEFLLPICKQWVRILKPGGFALCFSQNRMVHRTALAMEEAGFEIRDVLAWKYEGQAKAFSQDHFIRKRKISNREKKRLLKKLGGRKTPQLKPQCELIVLGQVPKESTFVDNWDKWETGLIDINNPLIQPDKFPGTIIPAKKPKERYDHMTAKPVDLLRHLIRIFSVENSLIFDPFAGSGSTGVAAIVERRRFYGTEIDKSMATKARQRIKVLENDRITA